MRNILTGLLLIMVTLSTGCNKISVGDRPDDVAVMETDFGTMVIGFFPEEAPEHVARFKELAREGFYNGILFHRVIPGFVIQAGDPQTKDPEIPRSQHGTGGSGQTIRNESNSHPHVRGTLAAARSRNIHSADSQFYICLEPQPMLDRMQYTVYGEVLQGMEVADQIASVERDRADNPLEPVRIISVEIMRRSRALSE